MIQTKSNPSRKLREFSDVSPSEEAVIGSCLLDPSRLDALGWLSGSHFIDSDLGKLFDLMRSVHDSGKVIDPILIRDECQRQGLDIDAARLAKLFCEVPHPGHAKHYAGAVVEAARLRELSELSDQIRDATSDRTFNSFAILESIERAVDSLRQDTENKPASLHAAGQRLLAEIDDTNGQRRAATTGIWSVDSNTGGIMPGEMLVLAARPGCGKTSFAMQVALHNAERDRPCLFVSLEMRAEELAARVFGGMADIDSVDIRSRSLSDDQRRRMAEAIEYMKDQPITIHDPAMASMRDIRATAKQMDALSLIVIDYLSLIQPADRRQQRWEQVSETSRSIKRLAKELKVPILCLQQLSRDADGQVPKLSHLRESGAIEQDADTVFFLHPEGTTVNRGEPRPFRLIIAKHRHTETGPVPLQFDGQKTKFAERATFDEFD